MNNIIFLIIGMLIVTYIPRLIPILVVSDKKLPNNLQRFLEYIPYTALGALIIPGVFTAIPDMPFAAIAAISFAAIFSWIKGGMIVPVLGSILVAMLCLSFV